MTLYEQYHIVQMAAATSLGGELDIRKVQFLMTFRLNLTDGIDYVGVEGRSGLRLIRIDLRLKMALQEKV